MSRVDSSSLKESGLELIVEVCSWYIVEDPKSWGDVSVLVTVILCVGS